MEGRRNALLADMARDAELERSDFLVRAGQQLERFMDAHGNRLRQLGGIVLIDEDPDYLAVAPDGTFRSRSRVFDESRGEWVSETEVIETAAELAELYNPADILQAFADAEATGALEGDAPTAEGDDGDEGPAAADPYAAAADEWAAGQPEVREAHDEQSAALALYELALDFQDRSQRTEAGLIEQFENAAGGLLSMVGTIVVVDDEDESLSLGVGGFRGKVVEEGQDGWQDVSSPDQIVRFYDPTDVFGDLAEALADAYPSVNDAEDGADADDDAESDDDAEDDGDDGDEGDEGDEGDGRA